jgi:hypothetical protein
MKKEKKLKDELEALDSNSYWDLNISAALSEKILVRAAA